MPSVEGAVFLEEKVQVSSPWAGIFCFVAQVSFKSLSIVTYGFLPQHLVNCINCLESFGRQIIHIHLRGTNGWRWLSFIYVFQRIRKIRPLYVHDRKDFLYVCVSVYNISHCISLELLNMIFLRSHIHIEYLTAWLALIFLYRNVWG